MINAEDRIADILNEERASGVETGRFLERQANEWRVALAGLQVLEKLGYELTPEQVTMLKIEAQR